MNIVFEDKKITKMIDLLPGSTFIVGETFIENAEVFVKLADTSKTFNALNLSTARLYYVKSDASITPVDAKLIISNKY